LFYHIDGNLILFIHFFFLFLFFFSFFLLFFLFLFFLFFSNWFSLLAFYRHFPHYWGQKQNEITTKKKAPAERFFTPTANPNGSEINAKPTNKNKKK